MVRNFATVLSAAQKGGYGVCSFNVYNYETILGVIRRAAQMKAPVILAVGQNYLHQMSCKSAVALVSSLAWEYDADVVLHLDHCRCKDTIFQAVDAGFDSVMFDGSAMSLEVNISATAEVVAYAHSAGAGVEGELGSLAVGAQSNEGHLGDSEKYTKPEDAAEFARRTGVDALAVSIGTVHGFYKDKPNIRVDILEEIAKQTAVPLVLHGGSGTPEETLLDCIAKGIVKVNINTEVSAFAVKGLAHYLGQTGTPHLSDVSVEITRLVGEVAGKYMRLLGRDQF